MQQPLRTSVLAAVLGASALLGATHACAQATSWPEYRRQAAQRIMEWNQGATYEGDAPAVLLSIPVLQIDLEADGSVQKIHVVREPQNAPESMQMAMDAIMRAAPFGDVSNLPKPWHFTETFLYNDDWKFHLRSLQR
ncbi:hypothetical protein [Variovorax gossypii]